MHVGRDVGGFPVRLPMIDVNTVGAGGGSIAWFDPGGLLKVGPDSAGVQLVNNDHTPLDPPIFDTTNFFVID